MKTIKTIIFSLLLGGFSLPSLATEQDFGFCYSCTESDMQRVARSKIGANTNKHVTVVNRATRVPTTYNVYKIVEPGLFQILTSKINTSTPVKEFIWDAYDYMDAIKSEGTIPVGSLPTGGVLGFPGSVHDLVGNFNGQFQMRNALSAYLSNQQGLYLTTFTNKISSFLDESGNLDSKEWTVEFSNGSKVTYSFTGTVQNGTSGQSLIQVNQKPNSMVDSEGNVLPDSGLAGFPGNTFTVSGGAGGNIQPWLGMLSRLRIIANLDSQNGSFTMSCYWTSTNHVQCDAE